MATWRRRRQHAILPPSCSSKYWLTRAVHWIDLQPRRCERVCRSVWQSWELKIRRVVLCSCPLSDELTRSRTCIHRAAHLPIDFHWCPLTYIHIACVSWIAWPFLINWKAPILISIIYTGYIVNPLLQCNCATWLFKVLTFFQKSNSRVGLHVSRLWNSLNVSLNEFFGESWKLLAIGWAEQVNGHKLIAF